MLEGSFKDWKDGSVGEGGCWCAGSHRRGEEWSSTDACGVAGLMPAWAAETVTYIHTDALGSVVAETDEAGNVIKRYTYEPYGAVVGEEVTDGSGFIRVM